MHEALHLAEWVRWRSQRQGEMTHLKLQKLVFYAYGAALAHELDDELGMIPFEPWEHGPVCRPVWDEYRGYGSDEIPAPVAAPRPYSPRLESHLADVVDVYGLMTAWALRCETHLEAPWLRAHDARAPRIDPTELRQHFTRKFRSGASLPVHLGGSVSAQLDFIPVARFPSLRAMADAVRATLPM